MTLPIGAADPRGEKKMRSFDDISSDYASAANDRERVALIREMDELRSKVTAWMQTPFSVRSIGEVAEVPKNFWATASLPQ